jgi:LCP family protein required for cell wall assembly
LWRRLTRRGKVVVCGATTLTLVSGCAGGLYLKLAGNINVETIDVVGARPLAAASTGQNILVLGSQTRDGQIGSAFGGGSKLGTDISDTAMLVHLSADREHAVVTSIPRDLIVARPECASRKDERRTIPGSPADMFDLAMNLGGPSCAVATVEHMSGMRVDHFIRVDFNGFRGIVNALGGVDVCVPEPGIHDWRSQLDLTPGHHTIKDQQALAFVRDRHGVGDGGDFGRIKMQQVFMSSLAQKVESAGTLSNPVTLYKLANAATSSLTVDPGLGSIPKLVSLARQLRSLTTHNITFITAPTTDDPNNRNRVMPAQPGFDEIWRDMAADHPIEPAALHPVHRVAAPAPKVAAVATVPGAEAVSVRVLNATHRRGQAAAIAKELRRLGFHVSGLGQAAPGSPTGLTADEGAAVLKSVLRGPVVDEPATGKAPGLTLTIGMDFQGLAPAAAPVAQSTADSATDTSTPDAADPTPAPTAAALPASAGRTADTDICSGLPRPRADAAVKPHPAGSTPTPTPATAAVVTPAVAADPASAADPAVEPAVDPSGAQTDPMLEPAAAPATPQTPPVAAPAQHHHKHVHHAESHLVPQKD